MYNKKEWVNDEIITKEALNNIENGIADLDAKMNDVATKKELQAVENNIAENNNELNSLKGGLVASLVAQGHKVDTNSSWKDLFDILLVGSDSVPNVPNPDVPVDGDGILLYKAGTQYNDTEFRNLCLANAANSLTSGAICYDLNYSTHVWFSYDGYINFNDYDRIEITAYTENSQQQPMIGLGITSVSGQQGYQDTTGGWEGTSHGYVTLMYNVTETKYTIPINYTGSGYLLLWMHRNNSGLGRIYITEIRVIPKETTTTPIEPR